MTGDSETRASGSSRDEESCPADAASSSATEAQTDGREAEDDRHADVDTSHLDDVGDGCGCAEVWEHTSAGRREAPPDERASEGDAEAD